MSEILQSVSAPALIHAIDANKSEFFGLSRYWAKAEVHSDPEMLWCTTNVPFALFNYVFRAQLTPDNIGAVIETVIDRCKSRSVPLVWYTGPATRPIDLGAYLVAHGFRHAEDQPGMAVDLQSMNENVPTAAGLTIEPVNDIEALKQWAKAVSAGFGLPDFAAEAAFDLWSSAGIGAHLPARHYVGWLNGEPVAVSSLFFSAGVAGIYAVATIPAARGQGIGAMMTLAPLREARAMGYRVGILQSSKMGVNVYRQLGFQEYCKIGHYVWSNEHAN